MQANYLCVRMHALNCKGVLSTVNAVVNLKLLYPVVFTFVW